jgi:arylsulfatase A-like enzyme
VLLAGAAVAAATRCGGRVGGPVIIFLVDTLRPDRMSTYGSPRETSPAATRLASEGVLFQNAFTLSSWTRPAIATLLTSRLPSDVGSLNRFGRLSDKVPYLPEIFQEHGWRTGAAVGNGNVDDPRLGFRRGFDRFDDVWGEGGDGKPFADDVVAKALGFIAEQRSPKFFLYVHVIDPHAPYKIPPKFRDAFGRSKVETRRDALLLDYDRAIRTSDEAFGRLAAAVKARGWWRPALVVFLSDHGEEFFEHGRLYHGATLYEEQTHVPLVVKYPDNDQGGSVRSDPVTLADVLPTLAEMMGWGSERAWVGESFWKRRFPASREIYGTEDLDNVRIYSLRRGPEKIIVSLYPAFARRAFRLDRDPGEAHGVTMPCGAIPPAASELAARAEFWRARDLERFPQIRFVKPPGQEIQIDLAVQLKDVPKPFLGAADLCRFGSVTDGESLRLRMRIPSADRVALRVSASDRGLLPPYRLTATDVRGRPVALGVGKAMAVFSERGDFLAGPTADEAMLRRLRSLGYLAGD